MTEWKKVKDIPLPKDRPVLAMWKGCRGVVEYCDEKNRWCFCGLPAQWEIFNLDEESYGKFSYWMELPEFPQEWLDL